MVSVLFGSLRKPIGRRRRHSDNDEGAYKNAQFLYPSNICFPSPYSIALSMSCHPSFDVCCVDFRTLCNSRPVLLALTGSATQLRATGYSKDVQQQLTAQMGGRIW